MSASTLPNATLTAAYLAMTPGSAALAARARTLLPSGIAHDSRHFDPYPIYVKRAKGPLKWDVDGNTYVDYFGGHGSLLLGHNNPAVMEAVHAALDQGTHFGTSNAPRYQVDVLARHSIAGTSPPGIWNFTQVASAIAAFW